MDSLSQVSKILAQIDIERNNSDKESVQLTVKINHILAEAFEEVRKLGLRQEEIIKKRIALEDSAFNTLTLGLEKK